MSEIWINLGVVLLFTLIGGFFSASEMALVSIRESQATSLAEKKPKRGNRLVGLMADPNRFLAAVQVGVTGRCGSFGHRRDHRRTRLACGDDRR